MHQADGYVKSCREYGVEDGHNNQEKKKKMKKKKKKAHM